MVRPNAWSPSPTLVAAPSPSPPSPPLRAPPLSPPLAPRAAALAQPTAPSTALHPPLTRHRPHCARRVPRRVPRRHCIVLRHPLRPCHRSIGSRSPRSHSPSPYIARPLAILGSRCQLQGVAIRGRRGAPYDLPTRHVNPPLVAGASCRPQATHPPVHVNVRFARLEPY